MARRITQLGLCALCFLGAISASAANDAPNIVFFGDSITAGYGVEPEQAFPALVSKRLADARLPFRVVNAGLSGDTSAGGLRRIDWVLQQPVAIFVLELGANDGLRGLPLDATRANLQAIIDKVKARDPQAKIVIAGMRLPPNLGADYTASFAGMFSDLANKNGAVLIPFLLEGVGGIRSLNQDDQIHPNAAGHRLIADLVWRTLEPLLDRSNSPVN